MALVFCLCCVVVHFFWLLNVCFCGVRFCLRPRTHTGRLLEGMAVMQNWQNDNTCRSRHPCFWNSATEAITANRRWRPQHGAVNLCRFVADVVCRQWSTQPINLTISSWRRQHRQRMSWWQVNSGFLAACELCLNQADFLPHMPQFRQYCKRTHCHVWGFLTYCQKTAMPVSTTLHNMTSITICQWQAKVFCWPGYKCLECIATYCKFFKVMYIYD